MRHDPKGNDDKRVVPLSTVNEFLAGLSVRQTEEEAHGPVTLLGLRSSLVTSRTEGIESITLDGVVVVSGLQMALPIASSIQVEPGHIARSRGDTGWTDSFLVSLEDPTIFLAWHAPEGGSQLKLSWILHADRVEEDGPDLVARAQGRTYRLTPSAEGTWKAREQGAGQWAIQRTFTKSVDSGGASVGFSLRDVDGRGPKGMVLRRIAETNRWKGFLGRSKVESTAVLSPDTLTDTLRNERLNLTLNQGSSDLDGIKGLLFHGLFDEAKELLRALVSTASGETPDATDLRDEALASAVAVVRWTGDPQTVLDERQPWEELLSAWPAGPGHLNAYKTLTQLVESIAPDWPPRPASQHLVGGQLPMAHQPEDGNSGPSSNDNTGAVGPRLAAALGLEPDMAYGRFTLAPDLSGLSASLILENFRLGDARIRVSIIGNGKRYTIRLSQTEGAMPATVILQPRVSRKIIRLEVDDSEANPAATRIDEHWQIEIQMPLDGPRTLMMEHD